MDNICLSALAASDNPNQLHVEVEVVGSLTSNHIGKMIRSHDSWRAWLALATNIVKPKSYSATLRIFLPRHFSSAFILAWNNYASLRNVFWRTRKYSSWLRRAVRPFWNSDSCLSSYDAAYTNFQIDLHRLGFNAIRQKIGRDRFWLLYYGEMPWHDITLDHLKEIRNK